MRNHINFKLQIPKIIIPPVCFAFLPPKIVGEDVLSLRVAGRVMHWWTGVLSFEISHKNISEKGRGTNCLFCLFFVVS